ncbi:class I SAM-dependent methyltransferase [Clostridium uliginosum]|uniref:Methyltransferase domain-containing protein n=1 Tax=Clostridium uliginosum TaxID=119641 RepID=A0A1I1QU72_9CLOT|nr:class I SAM-dependent methyltransferase [Clostridium uliginosum]SFD25575.1 Methyltransferase domain-containing protein [Clostridium uliginosum]
MSNWTTTTDESKKRWEKNADFWDERMGEHSNTFHTEIIRPSTEVLLEVNEGEEILDIACGNGNFSKRLVDLGAEVTAFDYSVNLIENAKKRCASYLDNIKFKVIDATNYNQLIELGCECFDKAVANMALMDIADINPLLNAVYKLLKPNGIFVFSIMHPCFQSPKMRKIVETEELPGKVETRNAVQIFKYITPQCYEGIAIVGQPVPQLYYHRSLSELLEQSFRAGFVVTAVKEPVFKTDKTEWNEIPSALIIRLRKD